MKHEKLIEKHLGVNTPYWIKEKVDNAINEALRQFGVMPSFPDGLDDDSNCDHNFKLGWIACWKALTGNEA